MKKSLFKIIILEEGNARKKSVEAFDNLQAASLYVQGRWEGPEYIDCSEEFHTDYCTYQLVGFTLKDIGVMGVADGCRTYVFHDTPEIYTVYYRGPGDGISNVRTQNWAGLDQASAEADFKRNFPYNSVCPIPLDPDGMNDQRAAWAEQAIRTFEEATGCDREDALRDLLTNLRHWCDRNGIDYAHESARAETNYQSDTTPIQ